MTLLSACTTPGQDKSVDEMVDDAVRNQPTDLVDTTAEELTAEHYISLATESTGKQREQYLLKAAELLYQRGDLSLAQSQLQNLDSESLARSRQLQINLLAAKIALANENPRQALELLPDLNELPLEQYIDAREVDADARLALGRPLEAVRIRDALDQYLDIEEREQNHEAIWAALQRTPTISMHKQPEDSQSVKGWIELAGILRNAQTNMSRMQDQVLDWGMRYPDHPVSNVFIDTLLNEYESNYIPSASIAILLPMEGTYKNVADAIQGGILSAWYADPRIDKPLLRFYDTSASDTNIDDLYQKATLDGVDFIIGPLDKNSINRLAQKSVIDIPMLTLNYAENPLIRTDNLYQFGLLPEDEAAQAAELAIRDNHMNAAVLVPNSDWGRRLQNAFQKRFEELGGSVLTVQQYPTNIDDYSRPLRLLLNLHESEARHQDLQRILGTKLEFEPHRRQDIDMIFLAATHRAARGIVPALKFYRAGELPVYATSHVYSGHIDKGADRDLNGVLFCDLPWTLTTENPIKTSFNTTWKDQRAYTRLFALGIDAYQLIQNLPYLESYDYARFSGETGNISLDENNRLHRELLWAKFKRGVPVYIDLSLRPSPVTGNHGDQS